MFKIIDFYGIPRDQFSLRKLERTVRDMHFHVGVEDEWSKRFTKEQISKANEIIGQDLLHRLGLDLE